MCIDFGERRCGIAVTDPLRIIVNGLDTVETGQLMKFITDYNAQEGIEKIIFGWPLHKDGGESFINENIRRLKEALQRRLPGLVFDYVLEDFSSQQAKEIILKSGVKKKKRREKGLIDKTAAVILLQKYLGHL